MRSIGLALFAGFLVFVSSAHASTQPVPWTTRNIKSAALAIGYPKPGAKKLGCRGQGTPAPGKYLSFRCVATYRHHRHRTFFIQGQGEGGWLCAGKTLTGCGLLKKGFATSHDVAVQGLGATADLAARGYMTNKYGGYTPQGFCKQTGSSTWSCPFAEATVTLTLKRATGGYVEAATS